MKNVLGKRDRFITATLAILLILGALLGYDMTEAYGEDAHIIPYSVDKSDLKDAIDSATKDCDETEVSEDGKDLADGTEYVSQEDKDALQQAINEAQAVYDNPDAMQQDIDAATDAVKKAQDAFDQAKKIAEKEDPKPGPEEDIWVRLAGGTRYDTMKAIVSEGFTNTGGTVIVATGEGFADALSAAGIAGQRNAPVILTNGKILSSQAKSELKRLKPKKVIVIGGKLAVTDAVLNNINKVTGIKPSRIAGKDSSETSAKIALAGKTKWMDNTAIIATNRSFKDALSVAPIAYAKGYPILLAKDGKSLTQPVLDALKTIETKQVIIVGGNLAVTKNVVSQLNKQGITVKVRLKGDTGVETSAVIAKWGIKNGMSADKMGVATSQNYPDSLAGAALCGYNKSVLILADDKAMTNATFPKAYKASIKRGYVFGGELAVGPKTWKKLNDSTK